MDLIFPVKKIRPRKDFSDKLSGLGFTSELHGLVISLDFLSDESEVAISANAFLDTGAPFSLFPRSFLELLPVSKTVPHTIRGIDDTPECQLEAEIANVQIRLKDMKGNYSPLLNIPVAFVRNENVSFLLGMKGLLDRSDIAIKILNDRFNLTFAD